VTHPLESNDPLTQLAKTKGLHTWYALNQHIAHLPYGRNANRLDVGLVLLEGKGSCSSKHALLKTLADRNGIPAVKLLLGMYKMSGDNTPKVGAVLNKYGMDYMPEAHCYLEVGGIMQDFTSAQANITHIEEALLEEREIEAHEVAEVKVLYHQAFLRKWRDSTPTNYSFEELWHIREECIAHLSA
jgi:hypothetical protein